MNKNTIDCAKDSVIVAATGNRHKIIEIEAITKLFGMNVIPKSETSAAELEVEETGTTFEENSRIKAEAIMRATGMPAIADDSGICVDALNGAPGIYSARFAGEHGDDKSNNEKLLALLKDVPLPKRTAFYFCALALVRDKDDPVPLIATGKWCGAVGFKEQGSGGFGYDPLFLVTERNCTAAQLPEQIKNLISHRARAMMKLKAMLHQNEL